jgi:predicted O-methyltransferase YrrM
MFVRTATMGGDGLTAAHDLARSRAFLTVEDVDLLIELSLLLPEDAYVVDLGAGSGTTALAITERRRDISVRTVDINPEAINSTEQVMINTGRRGQWSGMCCDSVWFANVCRVPIDLLLIDTSHTYEGTKAELEAWLPKLTPGALIWMHDYKGSYPGVRKAIREACKRGEMVKVKTGGLGWVGKRT